MTKKDRYDTRNNEHPYWEQATIRPILKNIAYLGHLAQQKFTSVSYKNHKVIRKDQSDWVIVYNTHEPIISQELWDKVQERMKSRARGRRMHMGVTHPLSGFLYCADCGGKLKMGYVWDKKKNDYRYNFDCGRLKRYGKSYCFSHHITAPVLEEIVLSDIREMAQKIVLDEDAIKNEFIRQNNVASTLHCRFIDKRKRQKKIRHKRRTTDKNAGDSKYATARQLFQKLRSQSDVVPEKTGKAIISFFTSRCCFSFYRC